MIQLFTYPFVKRNTDYIFYVILLGALIYSLTCKLNLLDYVSDLLYQPFINLVLYHISNSLIYSLVNLITRLLIDLCI